VGIHALATPFRGGTLRDVALKVLDIAKGGLERRGHDEAAFLKSLQLIAESGKTPADAILEVGGG
jgi:glutamate--cysteine ligase